MRMPLLWQKRFDVPMLMQSALWMWLVHDASSHARMHSCTHSEVQSHFMHVLKLKKTPECGVLQKEGVPTAGMQAARKSAQEMEDLECEAA